MAYGTMYVPGVTLAELRALEEKTVPRYGVRFEGSANSGDTVHRLYDAAGLVSGVDTDTETAKNDFDRIYPWSARRRCCGYWNDAGVFVVNAYKGEPGYAEDGSNGEVWVEHSLFYYKHIYDGEAEEIVISARPLADFLPAPIFLGRDGVVYQKAYTAAYPMATVDGKATSRSGVFGDPHSLNSAVAAARTLGERYTVTRTAEWYTELLYMWVEFATRDLQSVMAGATNMACASSHQAVVSETNVNRIVVTNAVAEMFVVGQTIGIGTYAGNTSIANKRIVISIDDYDWSNKAIYFDGDPVSIEVGNVVFSLAWKLGSCDGVLSSSGSRVSNTSGKYNCIYRGKEGPYGNGCQHLSDVLIRIEGSGSEDDPRTYTPYFLPDATKYSGTLTEDYVPLNIQIPTGNGYVKRLGLDERFPWVQIPCETGTSATTWYSDYYYIAASRICVARVGGTCHGGAHCGPVCYNFEKEPSYTQVDNLSSISYCR